MNRLESAWDAELHAMHAMHLIQWYAFEPMSLRLAKGASYTPDFVAIDEHGQPWSYECKGWHKNDQAWRVRIKVAARACPWMRFLVVKRDGKRWETEEIGT